MRRRSSPVVATIFPVILTREHVIAPACPLNWKRHCGCFFSSFLLFLPPPILLTTGLTAAGFGSAGATTAGRGICMRTYVACQSKSEPASGSARSRKVRTEIERGRRLPAQMCTCEASQPTYIQAHGIWPPTSMQKHTHNTLTTHTFSGVFSLLPRNKKAAMHAAMARITCRKEEGAHTRYQMGILPPSRRMLRVKASYPHDGCVHSALGPALVPAVFPTYILIVPIHGQVTRVFFFIASMRLETWPSDVLSAYTSQSPNPTSVFTPHATALFLEHRTSNQTAKSTGCKTAIHCGYRQYANILNML